MKYLVIGRNKDSYYALTQETRLKIRTATNAFVEKYRKAGKMEDGYFLGDMKGGVSIWELGSSEEAARIDIESPMSPFQDIEIIPIIEWDIGSKVITEAFEKAVKK